ncbi:MAG: hypothetical protein ACE5FH_04920 [Candidatus Zixiibacteriota bacterium]
MKHIRNHLAISCATAASILLGGCLLTGTWVVETMLRDLVVSANQDSYYERVDITDNDVWQDHSDDVKDIDAIGFEMWATNSGQADNFDIYIADTTAGLGPNSSVGQIAADGVAVLEDLPLVANGKTYISYPGSFSYFQHQNLGKIKKLVEQGAFDFFAFSNSSSVNVTVDSVRVVLTLTAGI